MDLYNIDDQKLINLLIDGPLNINQEYFWTDHRVNLLCQAITPRQILQLNLDVNQYQSTSNITNLSFKHIGGIQITQVLCLSLRNWGLANIIIDDLLFTYLGVAFGQLIELNLDLSGWGHSKSRITDLGVISLFTALPKSIVVLNINLKNLGYRNPKITGNCLVIFDLLTQLPYLQELTIGMGEWGTDYNKSMRVFTDESILSMTTRLTQMCNLAKLHINLSGWGMYGSLLTDLSVKYIIDMAKQFETIDIDISLRGWLISKEQKDDLQRILGYANRCKRLVYQWTAMQSLVMKEPKLIQLIDKYL